MSFIGNSPNTTGIASTRADRFNGDGSTMSFTLSNYVTSTSDILVTVNNVIQDPGVAYNVSGNTLTFTGAPSVGTGNITVVYRQIIQSVLSVAANSISAQSIAANTIQPYHLASGMLSPTVDVFTANGTGTTYVLSSNAIASNACSVTVNGITQSSPMHYSVTGNILTFTSAPAANSTVRCSQGAILGTGVVPLDNSVTTSKLADGSVTAAKLAAGAAATTGKAIAMTIVFGG